MAVFYPSEQINIFYSLNFLRILKKAFCFSQPKPEGPNMPDFEKWYDSSFHSHSVSFKATIKISAVKASVGNFLFVQGLLIQHLNGNLFGSDSLNLWFFLKIQIICLQNYRIYFPQLGVYLCILLFDKNILSKFFFAFVRIVRFRSWQKCDMWWLFSAVKIIFSRSTGWTSTIKISTDSFELSEKYIALSISPWNTMLPYLASTGR